MWSFEGKVALVTGGASGIGRAAAFRFAEAGARVVVADLQEAAGEDTVREIRDRGGEALFLRTDVTRDEEVVRMIDAAVRTYRGLHCAFNNAGVEGLKGVSTIDLTDADWSRILSINLTSVFLCMRAELRHMVAHGGGTIVNNSSTAGVAAAANAGVAYGASKHGVIGLTKTAAKEYAGRNIRINAICPGAIATPLFERTVPAEDVEAHARRNPTGRIASPGEVAESVLWLCSPSSSYVTGVALVIDGGRLA